jgi:acyl-CoA dehydrogenase
VAWEFRTDAEYQREIDWADRFVREEVEWLDLALGDPFDRSNPTAIRVMKPLQEQVKERGLWACHLEHELGGQGYGQLKLALLNEVLGRSRWAPTIFGCQAPDSGNAEILARFGTDDQKRRYLQPLLEGDVVSCYSMTEPQVGADPQLFTTRARREGDSWILNGEKWFSSNARFAAFFIVMAVTDPDVSPHSGMSMFIVPAGTPGLEILRNVGIGGDLPGEGTHGYLRYNDVRIPADHLLGEEGSAFAIAQTRLGGGRIHHAMRTIAQVQMAFDMMCERALSRTVSGGSLATLQMTQEKIADSWLEIEQFRLFVLRTAWLIDEMNDYKAVRKDIAAVKIAMPRVFHDVVMRAMHLHGALGISNEMPFAQMLLWSEAMALADGPSEVHKITISRQVLRDHEAATGMWPTAHLPGRREDAQRRLATVIEHLVGNA